MSNRALCFLYNTTYRKQGDTALLSAKLHNKNYDIIHLTDADNSLADIVVHPSALGLSIDDQNWMTIGRVAIVKYAIDHLGYDSCIFIDGDTYTYNHYIEFQEQLDNNSSVVVIPHITKPLPEDGKYPQNRVISLAGNYNSGFFGVTKKAIPFLEWWQYQTSIYPKPIPEIGLAAEQGWLRFAPDFIDDVKIFRHPGYNVAYWNIKQRELKQVNNKWIIDDHPLSLVHFSGLTKDTDPRTLSVFQNRYVLLDIDPVYILYKSYYDIVFNT
jgi:hypothetical protein